MEIAVISPFREQIWRLRKRFRELGLAAVNVGAVEVYQGAERRVTILSPVRSRERFVGHDTEVRIGLMHDRKRLSVATTRAQEALIVVGSMNCLASDPFWKEWIFFALRNGCFTGAVPPDLDLGAPQMISAMEVAGWEPVNSTEATKTISSTTDSPNDPFGEGILAARMATTALLDETEDD